MTTEELDSLLAGLSRARPIFHSEADFQHALAWVIHLAHEDAMVRLETRPFANDPARRPIALDMAVSIDGVRTALELKYLVRAFSFRLAGEQFNLQSQAAQDIRRYDVIKDIKRVEDLLDAGHADAGFVIVITNDQGYWTHSTRSTVDEHFRLHDGRALQGELRWGAAAGAGTTRGREAAILLRAVYQLGWKPYSEVNAAPGGAFRYLLVPVPPADAAVAGVLPVTPGPST